MCATGAWKGASFTCFSEDKISPLVVLGAVLLDSGLLMYLLDESNRILIDRSLSETDDNEDGNGKQQLTQNKYYPSISPYYTRCHNVIITFVPHTSYFSFAHIHCGSEMLSTWLQSEQEPAPGWAQR